ncbi:hypothetical protein ACFWU5_16465 [Nocardia sp. NPDC058640]|uniref:hypothetical protein n=1 Tax=Nocardia sp. NPDC058640 TaxID=3346571 RepID=UPI00364726A5
MTTFIGHLARLLGGAMDNGHEPYVPRLADTATTRIEYRLLYRSPDTGEEFTLLTDASRVWSERKAMQDCGYQVVVTKRLVETSGWEIVEEAA